MYALNKAQIIGHLTQSPEVRQTPSGQTVGDLNVVSKQTFINSSGVVQTTTSYLNIVVWRGLADISQRFLRKGSQVYLSGRIQTDSWEDQEGQKRYKTRVVADDLILLDPRMPSGIQVGSSPISYGLNQAEIIGNLTKDPEVRQTPNGDVVCSFSVATNFAWKDRMGQEQKRTEYHNVVAWGQLANHISQQARKGRKIYVAGRLQTRNWETPDGQKRWTTEIVTDRALVLGVVDSELGQPNSEMGMAPGVPTSAVSQVTVNQPMNTAQPAAAPAYENPTNVPPISYEPEIKPEDLPF